MEDPEKQFMEMAAMASTFKGLFDAYVAAGFTENQTLKFLLI